MPDQTRGTVVLALAANIGVAVIKLAAGLFTGSPAMLSEAARSVADTMNEVFLLVSLRRSERPADRTHPFGYGKERFFYALLAAMGIFLSGAAFSAYQGVSALLQVFLDPSEVTTGDLDRTQQNERQTLDDVDQLNGPGGVAGLRLPRSRSARRISSSGS